MIERNIWRSRIESVWSRVPVVWLSGVRRAGKTTLAGDLDDALYVNCDLPRMQARLADPEAFYAEVDRRRVIFDEVHQLDNPSQLLKIGADGFPRLRILATGSSTLAATRKFRDSLTGRKRLLHLTPVLFRELPAFGIRSLDRRLLHGGLPEMLLNDVYDPGFYAEWLDSYYARDIQELFRVEKRNAFLKLIALLLIQSGGLCDVTSLAREAGLSRPTVLIYLDILEMTHVIQILRPFHGRAASELVRQPKVYAFDTGFVLFARGWSEIRAEDRGHLWEHLVLDEISTALPHRRLHYWRDKSGNEVDFVLPSGAGRRAGCVAIECKWDPSSFSVNALRALRALHPHGRNFVVSPSIETGFTRRYGDIEVRHDGLTGDFLSALSA